MGLLLQIVALLAVATCSHAYVKRYDGYKLLEITLTNSDHYAILDKLRDDPELDFWYESREVFHILVSPRRLPGFQNVLAEQMMSYWVRIENFQLDLDVEQTRLSTKQIPAGKVINYDDFNTYEDIMTELDDLAARCAAGVMCETYVVGTSVNGRQLKALRMYKSGAGRKAVWLDATIHAREWLATATHLKIMKHLVDDYTTDAEVRALVDTYDWYLLPVVNPDGYVFTWTNDRMWRKSRNINAGSACVGTDLNRNFEEMWGNAGASTNPCSETYRGSSAGSEPETQAVQREAVRLGGSLVTAISFHTYGQLWLMPWGSVTDSGACNYASDELEMLAVANAAANAVEATYGTTWARGNSCATIYPASGITMDYVKATGGVKYTFTPELRGNNFVIAASQIEPSFQEVWNGVTAAIAAIP